MLFFKNVIFSIFYSKAFTEKAHRTESFDNEETISPFLKEERYAIHQNKQNEQKQFLGREPPLSLKGEIGDKLRLQISLHNISEEPYEDFTCKICDNVDRYCGIQFFISTDF